ncbi:MAG: Aminoacylase [Nocardioidaceae bacterium]|nr:Aminoacylase [Nocardioidaceae bacterium]
MSSWAQQWRAGVRVHLDDAVTLRHALHAAPYLGGEEGPTSQAVVDWLALGEGTVVAETGRMVTVLGGEGAPVVLRAELDGLPIEEATGVPWAATNGSMQACGHDVHLAALAAVARAATGIDLPRPLLVLLQPREEGARSGARDVVAEGALAGVAAVVAAHVQPRLPAGVVASTPGPVNAATDEFTITVRGRGGHSGYPHTVDDSVLALSATVVALQQVGARRIDPTVGVACMVNQLRAGTANNVVPGVAVGSGTVRTMRPEDRDTAHRAIADIATATATAYGCAAEVEFDVAEPVLVNDVDLAVRAGEVLGEMGHAVDPTFRSFGSDDFSYYCEVTRGLMLFVGTGAERGGLHDATYLPDDAYVGLVADALVAGYCAAVAP